MLLIRKINAGLINIGEFISALCTIAMVFIVTLAVIARLLNIQFVSADELARYVMIWSIYIGIISCTRRRGHIAVEILPTLLKGNAKKVLQVVIHIIVLVTLIWLFKLSVDLVGHAVGNGQRAPITRIPYWFMYSSMTIGLGMSFIRQLEVMVQDIRLFKKKSNPDMDSVNGQ